MLTDKALLYQEIVNRIVSFYDGLDIKLLSPIDQKIVRLLIKRDMMHWQDTWIPSQVDSTKYRQRIAKKGKRKTEETEER